jgi:uncharacterized membrane protein
MTWIIQGRARWQVEVINSLLLVSEQETTDRVSTPSIFKAATRSFSLPFVWGVGLEIGSEGLNFT